MLSSLTHTPSLPAFPLHRYHPLYPPSGAKLQDHELAYLLSHVEIWARIVIQRLPFALVFEDDLVQIEKAADWKARVELVR